MEALRQRIAELEENLNEVQGENQELRREVAKLLRENEVLQEELGNAVSSRPSRRFPCLIGNAPYNLMCSV